MHNNNSNINSKTLQKEEMFYPQKGVYHWEQKSCGVTIFLLLLCAPFSSAGFPPGSAATGTTALDPFIIESWPILYIKTSLLSTLWKIHLVA